MNVFLKYRIPRSLVTACQEFIRNEITEIAVTSVLGIPLQRSLMKNKSCEEEKKKKKTNGQINTGAGSEIKVSAVCQRATGAHSWVDCT